MDDDRELESLWHEGLFDDEIAERLGRTQSAIKNRRERLGFTGVSYEQRLSLNTMDIRMPEFEDITPEEAYRITRGVKRSAPFQRQPYLPLTQSNIALCQENQGGWKRKPPSY